MTPSGGAPSARVPRQLPGWRLRALIAAATVLALLGGTVLVLLSPPVVHVGLDYGGSAARLGISSDEAYRLSGSGLRGLLVGPRTLGVSVGGGGGRRLGGPGAAPPRAPARAPTGPARSLGPLSGSPPARPPRRSQAAG